MVKEEKVLFAPEIPAFVSRFHIVLRIHTYMGIGSRGRVSSCRARVLLLMSRLYLRGVEAVGAGIMQGL